MADYSQRSKVCLLIYYAKLNIIKNISFKLNNTLNMSVSYY
jgi:hypothetical protein